jgi:hypothetical protein
VTEQTVVTFPRTVGRMVKRYNDSEKLNRFLTVTKSSGLLEEAPFWTSTLKTNSWLVTVHINLSSYKRSQSLFFFHGIHKLKSPFQPSPSRVSIITFYLPQTLSNGFLHSWTLLIQHSSCGNGTKNTIH